MTELSHLPAALDAQCRLDHKDLVHTQPSQPSSTQPNPLSKKQFMIRNFIASRSAKDIPTNTNNSPFTAFSLSNISPQFQPQKRSPSVTAKTFCEEEILNTSTQCLTRNDSAVSEKCLEKRDFASSIDVSTLSLPRPVPAQDLKAVVRAKKDSPDKNCTHIAVKPAKGTVLSPKVAPITVFPSEKANRSALPSSTTISSYSLSRHKILSEFTDRYTIGDELGSGGFGFVVSAVRQIDNKEFAVKFIHKHKVPVHGWIKDSKLGVIPTEVYVLKKVRYPGIVRFIEYFEDSIYFYLVMELHGTPWCDTNPTLANGQSNSLQENKSPSVTEILSPASDEKGPPTASSEIRAPVPRPVQSKKSTVARPGFVRRTSCDLFECIEHHRTFSEENAKIIHRQLVNCVHYLDKLGICHRDIKDENIVIDKNLNVKLVDFGSAVVFALSRGSVFHRFYGTINYASPEILKGEPYCAKSAEVWSLGVLLYTLLFGEVPFNSPQEAITKKYHKPQIWVSKDCIDLLDMMLEKDPEKRATIEQVANHLWLVAE